MTSYALECNLPGNIPNMENMVLAVDPEAVFTSGSADYRIAITISGTKQELTCQGRISGRQSAQVTFTDREIGDSRYDMNAFTQRQKEMVRKGALVLLQKIGRPAPPWGILTGVRPSKLYHYLRDLGFSPAEVKERLQAQFMLAPEKAAHLAAVGEVQRPWLQKVAGRISIYIGIPFCPTKCHYCSFASYPLATHAHLVEGFLAALAYEIAEIGKTLARMGHSPATLYIGGGTPTVLTADQLRELLEQVSRSFPLGELLEYTVEAGRPDTLDREKLKLLRDYGVTRVSVNPQTFNPRTLVRIGRQHTVEQVEAAVAQVRALDFPCLNMDMILGLPGEQEEDWDYTLEKLLAYRSENITLHTLAPKRAATWDFSQVKGEIAEERVANWLEAGRRRLVAAGYYPYYLYRQRRIVAGQENSGYTLPGREGIYNIIMMEERATVLGLGGGGMSKWFDPVSLEVSRTPNPKCPATYRGRIKELVAEKVNKLLASVN
ncbi:MAG TPA: coproporphyrinogen dehydrogenase HemZ [Firmicutes bacterium]|uniref:Coproporphyrinogen dehydrogenase HemZ n=1 Tax=Capillibacterium thermochitinicola TaxID=2699427 RepID=A0A8J6LJ34_9FIRM|nr:coproporphyrinogen dehydrogenase HemZ [Capillibacterium thermochitinicola]MBA2133595.1 coproporphyrinogen dehydrogenase HemZ [Capillibacterium thermochitinicola]HHW12368.1 coproporphyrinogen dehydrogenase HemZ [Bacillota bacterium]